MEYQADIGQLLLLGQSERAVIRAEKVVIEQNMLYVFDMMESYCNYVNERAWLLLLEQRECPEELREAAAGLTFIASRFGESGDLPALQDVRRIFAIFFGEEFADKAAQLRNNCCVSGKLVLKFFRAQPSLESRIKAVQEIAMGIGIELADPIFKTAQALAEPQLVQYPIDKDIMTLAQSQFKCVESAAQAAADSAALSAALASTLLEQIELRRQE